MKKILLLFCLLWQEGFAQQKYVVSPSGDAFPITKGKSATSIILQKSHRSVSSTNGCGNKYTFGYPEDLYPPSISHTGNHKDVIGQWYVAKASGTIDTIWWENNWSTVGAKDSTLYVRIHNSVIGPTYGPGVPPFPAPCQNWGYWESIWDQDQGIAAFPDDAPDTTWISTIKSPQNGRIIPPTRPPIADEIWGLGGYPTIHHPGINFLDLGDLPSKPSVIAGQKFFISFRIASEATHVSDEPTGFASWDGGVVSTSDENWPSHNWKFYEHDSGPSQCAGAAREEVKKGWIARGPFGEDTNMVAYINIWYSMTVTSNVPPTFNAIEGGDPNTTFDTGPQFVRYEITDCNPANPAEAGVASAILRVWKGETKPTGTEYGAAEDFPMDPVGLDLFEGVIPGQPAGTSVTYRVIAVDLNGMTQQSPPRSYRVVTLKNDYYYVDTNYSCSPKSISESGTEIYTNEFFSTPYTGHSTRPTDDGTAGPFDLGGPFVFFGDTVRYAWVGINGAIALSKTATDTIDVNANGFHTINWDFPMRQHHHRPDTVDVNLMPPNLIAPYWVDLIYRQGQAKYGRIMYGDGGDQDQFMVEWDSIGTFGEYGPKPDSVTFRIILNRADGTIEFQYKNVGDFDEGVLVGMQADSNSASGPEPPFIFVNRYNYPFQSKPRNNWCIKFYPATQVYVDEGWHLLSVANDLEGDMAVSSVYPTAIFDAFIYECSCTHTQRQYCIRYTGGLIFS